MILSGNAKEDYGSSSGTYILQNDFRNGYPYWQHESKAKAIWWEKFGSNWIVGSKTDLGGYNGYFTGPQANDEFPTVQRLWSYSNVDGEISFLEFN